MQCLKTLIGCASWVIAPAALLASTTLFAQSSSEAYVWQRPAWVPKPIVPLDNPMSAAKVELGRYLFYDKRFSINGHMACATCHQQRHGFAEPRATALGATGEAHPRNTMALANIAYTPRLTWANPVLHSLEAQALIPLFGATPLEMGLAGKEAALERLLARDPRYERLFTASFPGETSPHTIVNLTRALAAFQRSLLSFNAPYDRFRYGGDKLAISPSAKRGERLFFSEKFKCFHCHGGITFSDSVQHARLDAPDIAFHNTGLYNADGKGSYPATNPGIAALTGRAEDQGKFRAPTLRNIAVTAPYMHDGSVATLSLVLDHYAAGGRAA